MFKLNLFTPTGLKKEPLAVSKAIFGVKINSSLLAQAIRVYLSNQRSGSAQSKTRNEINVTHAKVWKQKGTGRARHGSRNAPIFVGGAKAHGPSGEQNYRLKLSKPLVRLSILTALSKQFKAENIIAVSGLEKLDPKTKVFNAAFQKLTPNPKKVLLITDKPLAKISQGTRNLPYLAASLAVGINAYQILTSRKIIFTPEAVKALEAQYAHN
ncbi:MAG: 50S ribosomal protein L4 [Patescibacteria group bacterium]